MTPHFFVRLILLIIAIPQYNSDYNIGIESTLYLSYRFVATEGRIQIHVEMTLAGERESRTFDVNSSTTVHYIEQWMIRDDDDGILPERHSLIFAGSILDDNSSLTACGVKS